MIEIKLTCETVAEAQHKMAALLRGSNITSGWEPRAIVPAVPTPNASTTSVEAALSPTLAFSGSTLPNTPTGSTEFPKEPSSESPEQPKRGRGRPRKSESTAAGSVIGPSTSETAADTADAGNVSTPEPGATAPAEPTSDAASSTSSETAPQVLAAEQATAPAEVGNVPAAPVAEASGSAAEASPSAIQSVSDVDLQKFSAKVAEKFGGPQKIFDACKPFLPEGAVARPTNIMRNEDRWAFIRQMEIESGMTFHG